MPSRPVRPQPPPPPPPLFLELLLPEPPAGGGAGAGEDDAANVIEFTLNEPESKTRRSDWVPADSGTPVAVTVCQVCQPPVPGTVTVPVRFAAPEARCSVPPDSADATRKLTSYDPVAATY